MRRHCPQPLHLHTPWRSDPAALDALSEVAAQLVERQLDAGDPALLKAARVLVDKLLYEASDKLAATPRCDNLRHLMAKIQRHDD